MCSLKSSVDPAAAAAIGDDGEVTESKPFVSV